MTADTAHRRFAKIREVLHGAEVFQALLLVVQPLTYSAGFPIPNNFVPQRSCN